VEASGGKLFFGNPPPIPTPEAELFYTPPPPPQVKDGVKEVAASPEPGQVGRRGRRRRAIPISAFVRVHPKIYLAEERPGEEVRSTRLAELGVVNVVRIIKQDGDGKKIGKIREMLGRPFPDYQAVIV